MLYFGDADPFSLENEGMGLTLRSKLIAFISDPQTKSKLQVEMVATVDLGEPFVKACYYLEGNYPLALDCYERVDQALVSVATEHIYT